MLTSDKAICEMNTGELAEVKNANSAEPFTRCISSKGRTYGRAVPVPVVYA